MFEELRESKEFATMTRDQRAGWLQTYKQNVLEPAVTQNQWTPEQRAKVEGKIDSAFNEVAYRSSMEELWASTKDLVVGAPGRLVTSLRQGAMMGDKAIASGMDAMFGGEGFRKAIEQKEQLLEDEHAYHSSYNPDVQKWSDTAVVGVATGGLVGGLMQSMAAKGTGIVSAWASPFLNSMGQGGAQAVASTAFSAGVGDMAIEATMSHVARPTLDKAAKEYGWSPEKRQAAELMTHLGLGLFSGFTLEYKLDKAIGNPLFLDTMEKLVKKQVAAPFPNLNGPESALKHLVADPEQLKSIARAFNEAQAAETALGNIAADPASHAVHMRRLQALVEGSETPVKPGAVAEPAEDQFVALARMIESQLDETAAKRAAANAEESFEVNEAILKSDEVRTLLEGPAMEPKPATALPKPLVRTDVKGNIVLRYASKEDLTPEAAAKLKSAGLLWQPKKMFNTQDKNTTGVFYGPATPEAQRVVNELMGGKVEAPTVKPTGDKPVDAGKPVEAPTAMVAKAQAAKQAPSNTFEYFNDGTTSVVRTGVENNAAVETLVERGYTFDETRGAFVREGQDDQVKDVLVGQGLALTRPAVKPVAKQNKLQQRATQTAEATRAIDEPIWRSVVHRDGKPAVKSTEYGQGKVRKTFAYMADQAVAKHFPEAYKWLTNGTRRSLEQGWTLDDVMRQTVDAYNNIKPGQSFTPDEIAKHRRVLSELEDMLESGLPKQQRVFDGSNDVSWREDILALRAQNIIDDRQLKTFNKILDRFASDPTFSIRASDKPSFYSFLNNVVYLKRPQDMFHEAGHWAWLNVLSKNDRLDFWQRVVTKYNTPEAWDQLWPLRKRVGDAADRGVPNAMETWRGHMQNITELYADMARHYIHSYHMGDPDNAGILSKVLKTFRKIYGALDDLNEVPSDLRHYVDRIMKAPEPRSNGQIRFNEIDDLVERSPLFQDRETFEQTIQAMITGESRAMQDEFLMSVLARGETALDAWKRSGSDLDGLLTRMYGDVLALHHLDAVDQQSIEAVLREMRRVFDPENQPEVIKILTAQQGRVSKSKYGEVTDPTQTTAAVVKTDFEARREFSQRAQAVEESGASAARQAYDAYKEFFSQVSDLYAAVKFKRQKNPVKVTTESRANWELLQHQLREERLAGAREETLNLDQQGSVDEFSARPKKFGDNENTDADMFLRNSDTVDGDEAFESPYKTWSDDQVRFMQLKAAPHVIGAMAGLEVDHENGIPLPFTNVRLNWNPVQWAKYGAPIHLHGLFYKGLKAKAKAAAFERWGRLTPQEQFAISQKWKVVTKNPLVRSFRPNEGLTPELTDIRSLSWRADAKVRRQMFEKAEHLQRVLTVDEQKMVSEMVTKAGDVDVTNASPRVRAAHAVVENMLQDVRIMLREAGVPQELLDAKGGNLLPQIFEKSAKNWWMQGHEIRRTRNLWESINAKFLAPQGMGQTWRHSQSEVQDLMRQVRDAGTKMEAGKIVDEYVGDAGERVLMLRTGNAPIGEPLNSWTVKNFNTQRGTLEVHAPYTKLQRELLKEQTAVVPRIVELAHQSSKLIAQAKSMQAIARNNNLSFDPATVRNALGEDEAQRAMNNMFARGWVEVPDTRTVGGIKRYGELAGKIVDPEAMYVLRNITSTTPEHPLMRSIFEKYRMGVSMWKIGKTAFNVTTHGINFIGNSVMCVLDGRNPLTVLWDGAQGLRQKGQLYKEAVDAGMVDSNILRSELGLDRWMRTIESQPNSHPTEGLMGAMGSWMDGISKGTKTLVQKTAYWPMRIYELGDQVYKMGIFAQARAQGMDPVEAMKDANRLFFDYRDVPQGIKTLRDWGIMPFISYTYKIIPRVADFAVNNPHRMLGLLGGAALASDVMMANEWGEDWQDVEHYHKEMMPDWMKKKAYGMFPGQVFSGTGKNEYGHEYSRWTDFSQVVPGGTMLEDGGIFGGFPFGTNPIVSIAYGLYANKDPHLGRQIAPYESSEVSEHSSRNAVARIQYIMRTLLPNLPAYSGSYSLERIGSALAAEGVIPAEVANEMGWTGKDYYGTPDSLPSELQGFATGVRNRKLYANAELVRKVDKLKFGMKKEQNELKRRLQDRRMSEAEIESQVGQLKAATLHNSQELSRLGEVYRKAQTALVRDRTGR